MHNITSNLNGTLVTKEKIPPDDGGIDIGLIIALISLILLLAIVAIVAYYFYNKTNKGLRKTAAADFIRNESTASHLGVINNACEVDSSSSSSNPTPSPSEKSLTSDDIKINILPPEKPKKYCDEALDVFLNNVECSVITSKDSLENHKEILQKVNSVRNDDYGRDDHTLFELLRTIENTSLSGITDLHEICKCDGNTITKVTDEKPSKKTETGNDLNYVRTISEIENGGNSNGIKDTSYFNIKGKHTEQF